MHIHADTYEHTQNPTKYLTLRQNMGETMISLWSRGILSPLRWELHLSRFQTEWWSEGKSMGRSRNKGVEGVEQFVLPNYQKFYIWTK